MTAIMMRPPRKRFVCCVLLGSCLVLILWLSQKQDKREDGPVVLGKQHVSVLYQGNNHLSRQHSNFILGEDAIKEREEEKEARRWAWEQDANNIPKMDRYGGHTPRKSRRKGHRQDDDDVDRAGRRRNVGGDDDGDGGSGGDGVRRSGRKKSKKRKTGRAEKHGMNTKDAERWIHERVKMGYCNPPDKGVTGEEGKFKPGYKLKAVHVIVRHGDRTPMFDFTNIPAVSWHPRWNCDLSEGARTLKSTILREFVQSLQTDLNSQDGKGIAMSHHFRNIPLHGSVKCQKSQLTPIGWLQHIQLGRFLRSVYGKTLVSQPHELSNISTFKSTVNTRTQQSAFSFMYGFLQNVTLADSLRIKSVSNVNFCPLHLCTCPALQSLVKAKEKHHVTRMQANVSFMQVMENVAQTLYGTPRTSVLPGINAVAEILSALTCHGMKYPCGAVGCVNVRQFANYHKYLEDAWIAESRVEGGLYEKLGRLFVHPFLTDMATKMRLVSQGLKDNHFEFNSGHDITIRPLIDALKIMGPGWPNYAARVVFELWQHPLSGEHFLRVLAYGKDETRNVRFCVGKLNRRGLCPLTALLSFVRADNMKFFNSSSYQDVCSQSFV